MVVADLDIAAGDLEILRLAVCGDGEKAWDTSLGRMSVESSQRAMKAIDVP